MANNETKKLSPEELQQTQVINLKDVEEVIKIEKRTSKKPAIILGIIGLALLVSGSSLQVAFSLKEKKEEQRKIEQRKVVEVVKSSIDCTKTLSSEETGLKEVYKYTFSFEDDKLVKENKVLTVTALPNNAKGTESIKNYKDNFKKYLNSTTGYEVSINGNDSGVVVTTIIDHKKIDVSKLNPNQKEVSVTNVVFKEGVYKNTILGEMTKYQYKCK
ncbi:MAG: hypothetical protein IKE63_02305 [Bacilli bacterium]|nr:hypothetical protein [Bacilli bacterium]